ncbi:Reversal of tor2 lethality [Rhizina undulata]
MVSSIASLAILALSLVSESTLAQNNVTSLTGTWSSKSNAVFTGPDFYDPVTEKMTEPRLTGSSYSFTDDGYFEEALYLAIANPTEPSCPSAVMQWQHGTYIIASNGSLVLHPIMVDGRQLYSAPCENKQSIYTRYNETKVYEKWVIIQDEYRGNYRLNLYKFEGTPMNPMYLAFRPPQMLPTQTLNPTSAINAKATGTSKMKIKRSLPVAAVKRAKHIDADRVWWLGVALTAVGFFGYFCV